MANPDTQKLIIQLKAKGVTLTKTQLKSLNATTAGTKAGMIAMGAAVAGATLVLVALGKTLAHSIKVGKAFEQSMANLKAISGATGSEMLKLEKTARKLGASTKFTASEVGNLQTEFAKLGFSTKEIQNATKATLDLAAATGTDLAESAAIAGQTVRAFQLNTKETSRVTDVMAKSFSRSALDMRKFTDSMSYVAPVAKMAGFSVEGATAMLGKLADAGISGSMAGTALRKIFLELSNENSKLAKRLGGSVSSVEELIPALQKLNEEGVSTAEMKDLVGLRATSAFSILLAGADDIGVLTKSLQDAGGAAERMAEIQLDTLQGKLTILNSAWEGFGVAAYDYFEEPLKSATEAMTSFIQSTTQWMEIPTSNKLHIEKIELGGLVTALKSNLKEEKTRKLLIDELNKTYPEFLDNIKEEELNTKTLTDRLNAVNEEYDKKIKLAIIEERVAEARNEAKEAYEDYIDVLMDFSQNLAVVNEVIDFNIDTSKDFSKQWKELTITGGGVSKQILELTQHYRKLGEDHPETIAWIQKLNDATGMQTDNITDATHQWGIYFGRLHKDKSKLIDYLNDANEGFSEFEQVVSNASLAVNTFGGTIDENTGEITVKVNLDYGGETEAIEGIDFFDPEGISEAIEGEDFFGDLDTGFSFYTEEDENADLERLQNIATETIGFLARRDEWNEKKQADILKEVENATFLLEMNREVMKVAEDGTKKAHQFTKAEVDLIAKKMENGMDYIDAVKEALEQLDPNATFVFNEDDTITEEEQLEYRKEMIQQYVDEIGSLMDQFASDNIARAKSEATEKINALNEEMSSEMKALKDSRKYQYMSDRSRLREEKKIQDEYEALKQKEKDAANKRIKGYFKIQQVAKVADIIMSTREAVQNAIAKSTMSFGLPWSAFAIATGLAGVAAVKAQQAPTMAEGGLIGGLPHSQGGTMINAESGEFVMNTDAVENMGIDAMESINSGGGQPVNISFSGNVLSDDFISDEALPKIREALRRGGSID